MAVRYENVDEATQDIKASIATNLLLNTLQSDSYRLRAQTELAHIIDLREVLDRSNPPKPPQTPKNGIKNHISDKPT